MEPIYIVLGVNVVTILITCGVIYGTMKTKQDTIKGTVDEKLNTFREIVTSVNNNTLNTIKTQMTSFKVVLDSNQKIAEEQLHSIKNSVRVINEEMGEVRDELKKHNDAIIRSEEQLKVINKTLYKLNGGK